MAVSATHGNCVELALVCEGTDDCGDGSDEGAELCHSRRKVEDWLEDLPALLCSQGFQCGPECLHSSVRCNGTVECPDYSGV